jgi:hypothetical protein
MIFILTKHLQLTANSRHFLRVSAQMLNLDKQKTAQIRIPLAPMRPADVKTFRRTKTVAFSRTGVLLIQKTFCLNKFNNISADNISGITFRFTFSVSPSSLGPGQRAVWPTQLQHICLARWTLCKAKQISCNRQRADSKLFYKLTLY